MTTDHISDPVDLSGYDGARFATWADVEPNDRLLVGSWVVEFDHEAITARPVAAIAFGPVLVRGTNTHPPESSLVEHILTPLDADNDDRLAFRLAPSTPVVRLTAAGEQ